MHCLSYNGNIYIAYANALLFQVVQLECLETNANIIVSVQDQIGVTQLLESAFARLAQLGTGVMLVRSWNKTDAFSFPCFPCCWYEAEQCDNPEVVE